jgi:DNA repair protein RadC
MNAPTTIERPLLAGTDSAIRFFAGVLDGDEDCLWVAHLDDSARCIRLSRVDSASSGAAPWRDILLEAVELGSAGLVTAQQQPAASQAAAGPLDSAVRMLARAAEEKDVEFLDHLHFAGQLVTSFRRTGAI